MKGVFAKKGTEPKKILREFRVDNIAEYKEGNEIGLELFNNQNKFIKKLEDNKLLTIKAAENVVRILPPLNVKKSEINLALKIIKKVCKDFNK